jgi:hypothetical protein
MESTFSWVCDCGSKKAKITHKNRKSEEISCFEMLDALFRRLETSPVRGASKIKFKNVNKKRTVTVRRVIIFFEYLKASIAVYTVVFISTKL